MTAMTTPDFTQPRSGWRRTVVDGQVLYLPRGISRVNGLWRVTVSNKQQYEHTLADAWDNLNERTDPTRRHRLPAYQGPRRSLDTGVIGVQLNLQFPKLPWYNPSIRAVATQITRGGPRSVVVGQIRAPDLTQDWIDRKLIEATGLRWYYLQRRQAGDLVAPIGVDEVPAEVFPKAPVRRLTVDEVLEWLDSRLYKDGATGHPGQAL